MKTRIVVHAKPKSYAEKVTELGLNEYRVEVREPPENGLANIAIRRALAEHLKISPSRVLLTRGASSKQKFFVIE